MAGRNKGTEFERTLAAVFTVYEMTGRAIIEKVDAPTKVFGREVIHLQSPFLDFVGVWTERGGQMIVIEAKTTKEPRLALAGKSGVTDKQLHSGRRWQDAGAIVLIIWQCQERDEVRVITPSLAKAKAEQLNRKSIRWCDACRMPGENGMPFDPLRWVDTWRK